MNVAYYSSKNWGLYGIRLLLCCCFLVFQGQGLAQDPSLFLTLQDLQARAEIARHEPWAEASMKALLQEADAFPQSYEKRFGLKSVEFPPEGGQWLHWYVCPDTGTPLKFVPPNHNVCPDTGKEFSGPPFDQVVYQLRNDALRRAAVTLALAYRFTNKQQYAEEAIHLLTEYADHYASWPLHDNHGKPTANGAKAYSQTLDESIWLIDISWTYDLVRGSGLLDQAAKTHIENDLLRASYRTVSKAHKEPTDNIQSWINAAIAAVGFTLHDPALIHEAIDGPIGFRYQMHHFVKEGFWIEGAFGYHFYALRALVATAQMAKCAGLNLWKEEPALLSLFSGPIGIVFPNGELPTFNDSNRTNLYMQDYLYEQAYAASGNQDLLPIITKHGRTNREALLFGVEKLPATPPLHLKSTVFAEAGYAALRSETSDFTVIAKFGQHGGAHGHFDKLSFVVYSQGRIMGVDPGTQLYGLPLHQQWDAMTIAHNTISVDQKRQAAATGKLVDWQTGPDWVAVTMDAGRIYDDISFKRSLVLSAQYCLIVDHVQSLSSTRHNFDWIYHNAGQIKIDNPTYAKLVTDLPPANGYSLLKNVKLLSKREDLKAFFTNSSSLQAEELNPNSPDATTRSPNTNEIRKTRMPQVSSLELLLKSAPEQEFMTGEAPGHDLTKTVPFILARQYGVAADFVALLSSQSNLSVQRGEGSPRTIRIFGEHVSDEILLKDKIEVRRGISSSTH